MTDNLSFFLNYNIKKDSILSKYDFFISDGTEEREKYISPSDTNTFILKYKRKQSSYDVIYKLYTKNPKLEASMLYEFYVGKCLNKVKQYFPNFIYTIGYNKRQKIYEKKDGLNFNINNMTFVDDFNLTPEIIEEHCEDEVNNISGLFIEYVPNSETLARIIETVDYKTNIDYNLFTTLFQIYATLYTLENVYAHQNLHLSNIVIIKLPKDINVIYYIDEIEYTLTTRYIPVFIDYATNYINFDLKENSIKYIDCACKTKCNIEKPDCCKLKDILYDSNIKNKKPFENPERNPRKNKYSEYYKLLYTNYRQLNKSIDLKLINMLMYDIKKIPKESLLRSRYHKINSIICKEERNPEPKPWEWKDHNSERKNIKSIVQEHPNTNPDNRPYIDQIRFTRDIFTRFLRPLYFEFYSKAIKRPNKLKIYCDLSEKKKWEYIKSDLESTILDINSFDDNTNFFFRYNTLININLFNKFEKFKNSKLIREKKLISSERNSYIYNFTYSQGKSDFSLIYKIFNYTESRHNYQNILYQYYIGQIINRLKQYFPNFMYTFGYVRGEGEIFNPLMEHDPLGKKQISVDFQVNKTNITVGCRTNDTDGLLIEYIKSRSLKELLLDDQFRENLDYNLFSILFQVYSVLYTLRDVYSHKDLGITNIIIIQLNNPINIIYKIDSKEYILITKYIPVFIDYATSILNLGKDNNSVEFINMACETSCNENCKYKFRGEFFPALPCNMIYNGLNTENSPNSYNSDYKKYAKSLYHINKTIDLTFILQLFYEKYNIPIETKIKKKFFELLNETTYPEWFFTTYKIRNITTVLKEYSPPESGDPHPDSIRYSWEVLTKLLIPYYKENYEKTKNSIYGSINIECSYPFDLKTNSKWIFEETPKTSQPPQTQTQTDHIFKQPTKKGERGNSYKPLIIKFAKFRENINEFCGILSTIEIIPKDFNPSGGSIDMELLIKIEVFNQKKKSELTIEDVKDLHFLFFDLPDTLKITKKGKDINKSEIYSIMNNLFNSSEEVSLLPKLKSKGGYYDKYIKYKLKYINLKNKLS